VPLGRLLVWSGVFASATALVKAAYFAFVIYLAAVLPPEAYALFGLLYALQTAIGVFAGVGVQESTIGRLGASATLDDRQELYRTGFGLFFISGAVAVVVLAVGAASVIAGERNITILAISSALLLGLINASSALQAGFLRLDERHLASIVYSCGVPLVSCAGSFAGFYSDGSVEAIFAGGLVSGAVGLLALRFAGLRPFSGSPNWPRAKAQASGLLPFAAIAIFGWFSGYGINFVIRGVFEAIEVARYTLLLTAASVAQMAATAMNMAWSPRFYRMYLGSATRDAELHSRRFFAVQAWALGLLAAVVIAILPWAAGGIGGYLAAYGGMRLEMALLFSGYLLSIPWWHAQNYFLIANEGASLMRIVIWTGVAGVGAWGVSMFILGEIGIYMGFVFQIAMRSIAAWIYARERWQVSPPWLSISAGIGLPFAALWTPHSL
jgi:O-antigen/teichoic acid export membrane protein